MSLEAIGQFKQLESDLVIIGGGGSGLAAALTAAEKGISRITVLEKRGVLGGNTACATGLFACESPAQARQKITADRDELFKRAMNWSHWYHVNPRIFRAFLNNSGNTIRWLEEKGLEFTVIAFFPNQNPRVEHVPNGRGARLTQVLADGCQKAGVKVLLNCAGMKLLTGHQTDRIEVTAISGDEHIQILTRSVIIATGGFGGNKTLLNKLCPQYYEDMPLRGLPLTGDGIQIAAEAGVAINNFVTLLKEGPRMDRNTWPLRGLEREPVTVWVNKLGKRFIDEATGNHPFESVNPVLDQPDRVCYSLVDQTIQRKLSEKISGLDQLLQQEISKNRVAMSDSWEGIARWIGADPAVLQSTIDEYNIFCDQGYDAIFAKDRRYLMPLRQAPYYAIRGYPHFLDTLGGIIINEHMEALNRNNEPVPGLFAAGVTTSGWESETYCSDLNGSAFGYAITSGRIAGENAAKYILNQSK